MIMKIGIFLGMILLVVCSVTCGGMEENKQSNPFVLGDNDYALSCDPTGGDAEALACQLAYLTNRERQAHPEESDMAEPLDWDDELAETAHRYSAQMCEQGFFDHKDPQGHGIEIRLSEAGIIYIKAGENLARGTNMEPDKAMSMFMNESPCQLNHRGNILDNDFTHIGVGVVFCDSKTIYTQLFATFDMDAIRDDVNEYCSSL